MGASEDTFAQLQCGVYLECRIPAKFKPGSFQLIDSILNIQWSLTGSSLGTNDLRLKTEHLGTPCGDQFRNVDYAHRILSTEVEEPIPKPVGLEREQMLQSATDVGDRDEIAPL
jgi:hypothetical protein